MLTEKQRQDLIEEMIDADLEGDAGNGGGLLDYFLRNGCVGYEQMTDDQLIDHATGYNLSDELEELIEGLTP